MAAWTGSPNLFGAAGEFLVNTAGAAVANGVTTALGGLVAVGGLVLVLLNGMGKDLMALFAVPDAGTDGIPDLTGFSVGDNFADVKGL